MLDAQSRILERMADGAPINETLNAISELIENIAPPALCSIMTIEPTGRSLTPKSSLSLPQKYLDALAHVEIGPGEGSCGTAAFRKETVIVTDIASDPLWDNYRSIALQFGLRACWSMPILQADGSILGTIALYYRETRAPSQDDLILVSPCLKLIQIALINEQKDRDLKTSEARWRIGIDSFGVGTYDVDVLKQEHNWSPRMREILGVSPDYPASYENFLALVFPEDRPTVQSHMPNYPAQPFFSPWHSTIRVRKPNGGEERIIRNIGCVLPAPDGVNSHIVGVLVDVTETLHKEQKLQDAKATAEAANKAKSHFLASMSHELRTPLNAIIGFSDMIRSQVFGPVSPKRYESYIEDIYRSGTHLLSLINDVLDMAKIEARKFELHKEKEALQDLADGTLLLVRPQALAKGVILNLDIPHGLIINVDSRAMRQVLTNFLSNAIKFTNENGTVRLFAHRLDNGGLAIGVEDTGAGMNAEGIALALEPFGQVRMDIATEHVGTGLGLPIAKALIEYHGASFHITSRLGIGTRVWGEFPLRDITELNAQTG